MATHRRADASVESANAALVFTLPDGETVEGRYRLYYPSANDLAALGEPEWAIGGGSLWISSVTDGASPDEIAPLYPLPQRGIFEWDGALWEIQGEPTTTPDVASVRALAVMKERL